MRRTDRPPIVAAAALAGALLPGIGTGLAASPLPDVENARPVHVVPAASGLAEQVDGIVTGARERTWIGWTVPLVPGRHPAWCTDTLDGADGHRCALWSDGRCYGPRAPRGGGNSLTVLLRAERGEVTAIHGVTVDCTIDAAGSPFHSLTGASVEASVAAGDRAAETLRGAIEDDPEVEVKRQAVFGLSRLPRDEGIPLLIRLARDHRHPEVRRSAMFWLAQSGDPRALELFEELLTE